MDLMFPMLLLFLIGAGAVLLVHRNWTSDVPLRPATALDKAGAVTNWILGILYLPLSLFFFLLGGMSSEIFMEDRSVVRDALCYVLSIMSIFTFSSAREVSWPPSIFAAEATAGKALRFSLLGLLTSG